MPKKKDAQFVIEFRHATQEGFEAFADELHEVELIAPPEVTFQDRPFLGKPYVLLRFGELYDRTTLIVDEGQSLYINEKDIWVK